MQHVGTHENQVPDGNKGSRRNQTRGGVDLPDEPSRPGDTLEVIGPHSTDGDAGLLAIATAYDLGIQKYIADSGSGHHLASREQVKSKGLLSKLRDLDRAISFDTAGGETKCTSTLGIQFPALDEEEIEAVKPVTQRDLQWRGIVDPYSGFSVHH